jgi:hypothetical protein
VISARDELLHLVSTLSDGECERALSLLPAWFHPGPRCPACRRPLEVYADESGEEAYCPNCLGVTIPR